jgi:hypothetical protein
MTDKSVYVISKQFYEEFYIFGIFTADELDSALTALAQESINEAQESKDELLKWYETNHLTYYRGRCEYGCEHLPAHLSLPIIEYSKTMFTVSEIQIGEVLAKGIHI